MRSFLAVVCLIVGSGSASAQVTGEFLGWTEDGRAVIKYMEGTLARCTPQPVESAEVSLDGSPACEACNPEGAEGGCAEYENVAEPARPMGKKAKKQKYPSPDKKVKLVETVKCKRGGGCKFDLAILARREKKATKTTPRVSRDYSEMNPDIKPAVGGVWYRADSQALVIDLVEDQPTNHVRENKFLVIDLVPLRSVGGKQGKALIEHP